MRLGEIFQSAGILIPGDRNLPSGLGCEASLWGKCSAPILAVDRLEYIAAIHRAITALEDARITLARMLREVEGGPAGIS